MIPPAFDLTVPDDWTAVPPTPGCAALVAEPETEADSFRCSVSLVFEQLVTGSTSSSTRARASRRSRTC